MNPDPAGAAQTLRIPRTVVFGPGKRFELGKLCAPMGGRALVVTGSRSLKASGGLDDILSSLSDEGVEAEVFSGVGGEPTVDMVEDIRRLLQDRRVGFVVAAGGGSVIDAAKAAAALVNEHHPAGEYQWGREITTRGLPVAALPTTSGTGAEVTPNAVITDPSRPAKRSIRHPEMLPRTALVDPELTYSCPRRVTAHSGLDALVQAIEAHTSRNAGVLTRALSGQAIRLLGPNLLRACGEDPPKEARNAVAAGSLLAGMALANARLGAVHGLAHPLGARFGIPHGLACGVLFPAVARRNEPVAGEVYRKDVLPHLRAPGEKEEDTLPERFERLLEALEVSVPLRLDRLPSSEQEWEALVAESMDSGSFRANPREMTAEEVRAVFGEIMADRPVERED